jgi:hypothetical protein
MDPITGVVEKKVAESVWAYLRRWFTRNQDQKKQIETLQAQLAEERSGKLAFQKMMSEIECRPEDENMYWRKDGKGGPYCPLCLHDNEKLIPMTHGREGAFYCRLHDHYFETQELRAREREARRNRAHAGRGPSRFGPHSRMGS